MVTDAGRQRDAAKPVNKTQLRAFLGLAGYYRRFVPNYAHVAASQTDMAKKDRSEVVKWSDEETRHSGN